MTRDSRNIELTSIDRSLIRELGIDARQTAVDLARKVGASRSTVQNRLQKLLDEGIIRIVSAPNPEILGYGMAVILGIHTRPNQVETTAAELARRSSLQQVIVCAGRYNLMAVAAFRGSDEFAYFITKDLAGVSGVESVETMTVLRIVKGTSRFVTPDEYFYPEITGSTKLDALDVMLVRELQRDSKQTQAELAEKLESSPTTIRRRIHRLLDEGTIEMVAIMDPRALGYQIRAAVGISVAPDKIDDVAQQVATLNEVHHLVITTGRYDLIAWAVFEHVGKLSGFLRYKLGQITGVTGHETLQTINIIRDSLTVSVQGP